MSKRGSTKSEPVLAASAGASASVVKKDEAPQKRNKVMSKTAMKRKRKKEAYIERLTAMTPAERAVFL